MELLSQFKQAARSVTNLYRASHNHSRHSYERGYQQALQDLQDYISSCSATVISATDLSLWTKDRLEKQNSLKEPPPSSQPSLQLLFGGNNDNLEGFTFQPLSSSPPSRMVFTPSTRSNPAETTHHHHHHHSSKRRAPSAIPVTFLGRELGTLEEMDFEPATKKPRTFFGGSGTGPNNGGGPPNGDGPGGGGGGGGTGKYF